MEGYSLRQLEEWNEKIESLVKRNGLDCYEQHFEVCSYEDMLCYEAYVGMPSHYPHWSYGKTYERQKTFYQHNLTGLPYEMVINSDPCIAYLMRDNTLLLQILTMAHVYGHNDFFKNNRLFRRDTRADLTVETFKAHADRVREYMQSPGIGPQKVERILDAAHGLRFQTARNGIGKPAGRSELIAADGAGIAERHQQDLLLFLADRGKLTDWERDLVHIVRDETLYFIPQMETKIMNEGWASFWHYKLLQQLELEQGLYLEFLQRHNLVIRPHPGRLNPYFVGFKMFEYLEQKQGIDFIKEVRANERDQSFLRRYLSRELCEELHLFAYAAQGDELVITDVSDEEGWKAVRDSLANATGIAAIPVIVPTAVEGSKLILRHCFDGRELELNYAKETLKYIASLWGGPVELVTIVDNKEINLIF